MMVVVPCYLIGRDIFVVRGQFFFVCDILNYVTTPFFPLSRYLDSLT